VLLVTNR